MTVPDETIYHKPTIASNLRVLSEARNLASVLAGVVAGILRVEGLISGGVCFAISMCLSSLLILASIRGSKSRSLFFEQDFFFSEFFSGLLVFVLTWTLAYDFVHLF